MPLSLKMLYRGLLDKQPMSRCKTMMQSAFFAGFDWVSLEEGNFTSPLAPIATAPEDRNDSFAFMVRSKSPIPNHQGLIIPPSPPPAKRFKKNSEEAERHKKYVALQILGNNGHYKCSYEDCTKKKPKKDNQMLQHVRDHLNVYKCETCTAIFVRKEKRDKHKCPNVEQQNA